MKVKRDGKLQTWLQGPGFEPVLVVDKHDMGWRVFNNVTIDTLYFSVFFGGSSPTFQARKDEVRHSCRHGYLPEWYLDTIKSALLACSQMLPKDETS